MNSEWLTWSALSIRVFIGSTLILLAGLVAIGMLRRQSAATKHLIGTFTFGALLLLPGLLAVLPSWELGWIEIENTRPIIPALYDSMVVDPEKERSLLLTAQVDRSELAGGANGSSMNSPAMQETQPTEKSAFDNLEVSRERLLTNTSPVVNVTDASVIATTDFVSRIRFTTIFLLIYIAGVAFGLLRMLVDYRFISKLISQATNVSDNRWGEALSNCRRAYSLNRNIECRMSEKVIVPMVGGMVRPVVLLPKSTLDWPTDRLTAAVAHEMAHVARYDVPIQLLVRIVRVFYWPQPLVYLISNIMRNERETACDDLVIGKVDRPTEYARHLLAVAAGLGPRDHANQAALAMARCSNVEQRIGLILSANRRRTPPARRAVGWMLALSTICLLVSTVFNPLSKIAISDATAQDAKATGMEGTTKASTKMNGEPVDAAKPTIAESEVSVARSYSGHVTDTEGHGVPNAKLWIAMTAHRSAGDPRREEILHEVGQTNERGSFRFDVGDALWQELKVDVLAEPALIAQAKGLGVAGLPLAVFSVDAPSSDHRDRLKRQVDEVFGDGYFDRRTIALPNLCNEVRGQLLDIEGNPLPNVVVNLEEVMQPKIDDLLAALQLKNSDLILKAKNTGWVARSSYAAAKLLRQAQPPIKSDANGEFRITGLGQNQLAEITFAAEKIEAQKVYVLGREMQTLRVPFLSSYPTGSKVLYHGTKFSNVLGPSVPLSGVVTEFQSRKPIANAVVYVERLFQETSMRRADSQLRFDVDHIQTVTDAEGRFTLHGIPPGEGHVLRTVPPKTDPWLMAKNVFSVHADEKEHGVNIQVFRGIWIEGEFTDGKTKEPLSGFVDYLALRKNPNIPKSVELQDDWVIHRFPVDKSGHYRVPGLPGPGVLLARHYGATQYPLAVGAENVDGYESGSDHLPTTPSGMPLTNWNRIQQIDPPVDATSFTFDLAITAGESVAGRVVGPSGEKIIGLEVVGVLDKDPFWSPQKDETFTISNYDATLGRDLFFKNADNSLVGGFQLKGEPPKEFTVTLQRSVTVTGRLIETEKDEPAVGYSVSCSKTSQGPFRVGDNSYGGGKTDENGRFEIQGLVPGLIYTMRSSNMQRFNSGKNNFKIDLTNVQPGAKIELGDVTGKNAKKTGKVEKNDTSR